jgi:pachytene checkpoint protein 2
MSGRALRRLPVLALAKHMGNGIAFSNLSVSGRGATQTNLTNGHALNPVSVGGGDVEVWLDGMESVIKEQATEHGRLI